MRSRSADHRRPMRGPGRAALAFGPLLCACSGAEIASRTGPVDGPAPWLPPAELTVVSGDGQTGLAGAMLAEPFVIRITNARGEAVASVPVAWSVRSGAGRISQDADGGTRYDGVAEARFEPTVLGSSEVTAHVISVAGSFDETVTFTAVTDGLQIDLYDDFGWGNFGFYAPDESNAATVPVGIPVEWVNRVEEPHTVTSTSAPPGGASFDSGTLRPDQRFRFVPGVPGTWEYVDRVTGAKGTITAELDR